jgi:hypothetical protein
MWVITLPKQGAEATAAPRDQGGTEKADAEALRAAIQTLRMFASQSAKDMSERDDIQMAWRTIERLATPSIRVPGEDSEQWAFRLLEDAWKVYRYDMAPTGQPPVEALKHLEECQDTLRVIPTGDGNQGGPEQREGDGQSSTPPVTEPSEDEPKLTERQLSILRAMLEEEVTSHRRRQKQAAIVRLINRTHRAGSYTRAFASLVGLGYLQSVEGPKGGTWITPAKKAEVQRICAEK